MNWEHKGVNYTITTEELGSFVMASARAPQQGMFVRVRPYSALGRSEEAAITLLKDQIVRANQKVPEFAVS